MPPELLNTSLDDELASLLDAPFSFRRRPIPFPAQDRIAYRLTILLLLLRDCSRQKKSTLKRLHFLDWAVRNQERTMRVKQMKGLRDIASTIIRYDPTVDVALRLAAAEKLIDVAAGRITLTTRGEEFLKSIDQDGSLVESEKQTMKILGKHVAEGWF